MRIVEIQQKQGHTPDGLGDVMLHSLGRVVVLTGPNGAGKSRLLSRIQVGVKPIGLASSAAGFKLDQDEFEDIDHTPVRFVSKELTLDDPMELTRGQCESRAQDAEKRGMENLAGCALAYIDRECDRFWNATHSSVAAGSQTAEAQQVRFADLQGLVKSLLGTPLELASGRSPKLFGRQLTGKDLSEGQRLLLQWATALHAQGGKLSESVILMDEPENYLHPESLINTVERIVEIAKRGQVWVATHSVALIAALTGRYSDETSVYFMNEGQICYSSTQPEQVLLSLMGGAENIECLREFIDLPEVYATNRFAAQCLMPPDVIEAATGQDPQSEIVGRATDDADVVNVLDYGCGKGRLLRALAFVGDQQTASKLNYVGWDRSDAHQDECKRVIEATYGSSEGRWFCDRQELAKVHSHGGFDTVILCNVLHEIDPAEWRDLFSETDVLSQSLSESGHLLIIEDHLMPKGEYAHPYGFIVLDTEPLQRLFGCQTNEIEVLAARDGRIKGHKIPKSLLKNVTRESIGSALTFACRHAKEKIQELRRHDKKDFRLGRAHGFWVQQFANTKIALELFSDTR